MGDSRRPRLELDVLGQLSIAAHSQPFSSYAVAASTQKRMPTNFLSSTLSRHPFFTFPKQVIHEIVLSATCIEVRDGVEIFREGESWGDKAYILRRGTCRRFGEIDPEDKYKPKFVDLNYNRGPGINRQSSVTGSVTGLPVSNKESVLANPHTLADADQEELLESEDRDLLTEGALFGIKGLVYTCRRNYTVRSVGKVELWVLTQDAFQSHRRLHHSELFSERLRSVQANQALADMPERLQSQLTEVLERKTYKQGETVIKAGLLDEHLYIIARGECAKQEGSREVARLEKGGSFGQNAVKRNNRRRRTSVVAASPSVQCDALARESLEAVVGSPAEVWKLTAIRSIPQLACCTDWEINRLVARLEVVLFKQGDVVFEKDQTAGCVYLLEEGEVQARSGRVIETQEKAPSLDTADTPRSALLNLVGADELKYEVKGAVIGQASLTRPGLTYTGLQVVSAQAKLLKLPIEAANSLWMSANGSLELMQKKWLLSVCRTVPHLSAISAEGLSRFAGALQMRVRSDGEEADPQTKTFVIVALGTIEVQDEIGAVCEEIGRGQFTGAEALTAESPPSAFRLASRGMVVTFEMPQAAALEILGSCEKERSAEALQIKCMADVEVVSVIGTGSLSKVVLACCRDERRSSPSNPWGAPSSTARVLAVKCLAKQQLLHQGAMQSVWREKALMQSCSSPFIVQMHSTFQDETNLYIVMEPLLGGDVHTLSRSRDPAPMLERKVKFLAACTTLALEYLHDKNICHRDVKPGNILIDTNGYCKLGDLGCATRLLPGRRSFSFRGTLDFMAPEVLEGVGHDCAVDWWALGMTIYYLLTGRMAYTTKSEVFRATRASKVEGRLKLPEWVSDDCKDLLKQLLRRSPCKRIGNLRGGVYDIRRHPWFALTDWDGLLARTIPSPWVPELSGSTDVRYFNEFDEHMAEPFDKHSGFIPMPEMNSFDNF
ncbi:hypothetical protein CYMTET_41285 [Cymbomonas tetramitiformis]|uniref:cGMP-dependent protein kinase n=1 Tax=Cymbomonas tetramitiformis TaxID=36881 RepID=A0AAE0F2T4_9CHLO|nr:hypothetical protein CYMTET_41285 [Cymbomonas tetramitiformis]